MLTRAKPDAVLHPKKFYADAAPGPVDDGVGVLLDGRPVRTPAATKLKLPTPALAQLIAAEWAAQAEHIVISDMPATRLAFTAIDRAPVAREAAAGEIAGRAGADVLCYFADGPDSLVELQVAHWAPMLDWATEALGLHFVRTAGLMHQSQPEDTLVRTRALALELSDFELTGEEAFDLSRLDEAFQEERWGVDEDAAVRTARLRHEARVLEQWFAALR